MDTASQDETHLASRPAVVIVTAPRLFGVPVPLPVFGFGLGWRQDEQGPAVGSRREQGGWRGANAADQTQVMTTARIPAAVMSEDRRHRLHTAGLRKPAARNARSGSRSYPLRLESAVEVAAA